MRRFCVMSSHLDHYKVSSAPDLTALSYRNTAQNFIYPSYLHATLLMSLHICFAYLDMFVYRCCHELVSRSLVGHCLALPRLVYGTDFIPPGSVCRRFRTPVTVPVSHSTHFSSLFSSFSKELPTQRPKNYCLLRFQENTSGNM